MKLTRIDIRGYRSVRDETVELGDLNVFIGGNASGKSTILDTLRFLNGGVESKNFKDAVYWRGGIANLGWKGEATSEIHLEVHIEDEGTSYCWTVSLIRENHAFHVTEQVVRHEGVDSPSTLLSVNRGDGWWWSGDRGERVSLKLQPTECALAAAAANASFPARQLVEFVSLWGFYDPSPVLIRGGVAGTGSDSLNPYGRNLAETLHGLSTSSPEILERIVQATRDLIGVPSSIEIRETEWGFHFVQNEPGLVSPVHQLGVSSGTLRIMALMTALFAEPRAKLIGIEEPENYMHPNALSDFVNHIQNSSGDTQCLVTTHSPLLLDYLDDPSTIRVVRRDELAGTSIACENNLQGVQRVLSECGLSLGQYHETQGFGVD